MNESYWSEVIAGIPRVQILVLSHIYPGSVWRIEFDQATVYGSVQDAFSMAKRHSNWGAFQAVTPAQPSDPTHPCRIVYALKPSHPSRRKYENRLEMKRLLGPHAHLVRLAARWTKRRFLTELTLAQEDIIGVDLALTPGAFWRSVRTGDRTWTPRVQSLF